MPRGLLLKRLELPIRAARRDACRPCLKHHGAQRLAIGRRIHRQRQPCEFPLLLALLRGEGDALGLELVGPALPIRVLLQHVSGGGPDAEHAVAQADPPSGERSDDGARGGVALLQRFLVQEIHVGAQHLHERGLFGRVAVQRGGLQPLRAQPPLLQSGVLLEGHLQPRSADEEVECLNLPLLHDAVLHGLQLHRRTPVRRRQLLQAVELPSLGAAVPDGEAQGGQALVQCMAALQDVVGLRQLLLLPRHLDLRKFVRGALRGALRGQQGEGVPPALEDGVEQAPLDVFQHGLDGLILERTLRRPLLLLGLRVGVVQLDQRCAPPRLLHLIIFLVGNVLQPAPEAILEQAFRLFLRDAPHRRLHHA
mmetsp:Transcript_89842/g.287988  ORF Transcript_89842/g.287988 Transcript_89842/m.287988 type:complete len:366 (-) Transcript_89842:1116-2213(-)